MGGMRSEQYIVLRNATTAVQGCAHARTFAHFPGHGLDPTALLAGGLSALGAGKLVGVLSASPFDTICTPAVRMNAGVVGEVLLLLLLLKARQLYEPSWKRGARRVPGLVSQSCQEARLCQ
jgi:hypothetical protein